MAYFKKIVGERCYLSPIDPDDAPLTAAWINDPEVAAGVTLARNIINAAQERDTLVSLAARRTTSPSSRRTGTRCSASAASRT